MLRNREYRHGRTPSKNMYILTIYDVQYRCSQEVTPLRKFC
eukprot:UN14020